MAFLTNRFTQSTSLSKSLSSQFFPKKRMFTGLMIPCISCNRLFLSCANSVGVYLSFRSPMSSMGIFQISSILPSQQCLRQPASCDLSLLVLVSKKNTKAEQLCRQQSKWSRFALLGSSSSQTPTCLFGLCCLITLVQTSQASSLLSSCYSSSPEYFLRKLLFPILQSPKQRILIVCMVSNSLQSHLFIIPRFQHSYTFYNVTSRIFTSRLLLNQSFALSKRVAILRKWVKYLLYSTEKPQEIHYRKMILNVFNSDINFASILNSMTIKFNKKFSNLWRFIFLFDDDVFKKSKELGILFDENSGIILFLL